MGKKWFVEQQPTEWTRSPDQNGEYWLGGYSNPPESSYGHKAVYRPSREEVEKFLANQGFRRIGRFVEARGVIYARVVRLATKST